MAYADAGHGHVFVRRAGGAVEGLPARGLPLGVLPGQRYPAGALDLAPGDALVVYSDGLLDARPDLALTPASLAARLDGAASAAEIVERLTALADAEPRPAGRPDRRGAALAGSPAPYRLTVRRSGRNPSRLQ